MTSDRLPISSDQPALAPRRLVWLGLLQGVDWLVLLLALGVGAMLAWLSVLRYQGFNADMFDLGNMAQAIASVRRGAPLVFTYADGQMSRLALHVEWFYFVLALPYALWPDPRLLVIAQSALFALGALPVYRMALRRTESLFVARCLVLIYLWYPVAQTGVLLDIHGDQLGIPLLLFALDALDRRAWRAYWIWIALALSCKFYIAVQVALLGLLIWRDYGARRIALATTLVGLSYAVLAFSVIRPLFTTAETSEVHRGLNYLSFYFGELEEVAATAPLRLANLLVVFGPALLLARYAWRWLLPGMPVALAALISTKGGSANYGSHHYGLVVPFIVFAAIVGVAAMQRRSEQAARATPPRRTRSWRGDSGLTAAIVLLSCAALVDTPLNPLFWSGAPGYGFDPSNYGVVSRDAIKAQFLREQIPPDAPVAASLFLAPHLVNRETLFVTRYEVGQKQRPLDQTLPLVDYVVTDALFDFRQIGPDTVDGGATAERAEIATALRAPGYGLVAARDGLLLFQRNPKASGVLSQQVEALPATAPLQARFGAAIGLQRAVVEPLGGRRYRARFEWSALGAASLADFVAVSRLDGLPDARIVHLPTYVLLPTTTWQPGQTVRESFDFEVPVEAPPGRYTLWVGWYDLARSEAYATDVRSRLGEEQPVATLEVD